MRTSVFPPPLHIATCIELVSQPAGQCLPMQVDRRQPAEAATGSLGGAVGHGHRPGSLHRIILDYNGGDGGV